MLTFKYVFGILVESTREKSWKISENWAERQVIWGSQIEFETN
jgi:hypothetical protein